LKKKNKPLMVNKEEETDQKKAAGRSREK